MRIAPFPAIALCLLLAGCGDPRRDAVREYVQAHPPEGFRLAELPGKITVVKTTDGTGQSVLNLKYRLERATVEPLDALEQPRGRQVAARLSALRGWALSSLPAGDPVRDEIAAATAGASAAIPVKRIVTPAGTEVEALGVFLVREESGQWLVTPESLDVRVPGKPDREPSVPLESSPSALARLDRLETLARSLEKTRDTYLAARARAAEQSLAELRARLRTGNTFEARLPDGAAARLVISRGLEGEPAIAVLTVDRDSQSSARYAGSLAQLPSGQYTWRAAQVTTLSGSDRMTDARRRPILTLTPAPGGLSVHLASGSAPGADIRFRPAKPADLIPEEESSQDILSQ